MVSNKNNQLAFFELLRAGLWEKEARISQYSITDYSVIMKLAEEQSVVGLITSGLERVQDLKAPQVWLLQFIGSTLQIEQKNKSLNGFVAELIGLLRKQDIYTILVKGQGIAQCYERPLWRSSGDIDLLLSKDSYDKAKQLLLPLAEEVESEDRNFRHLGISFKGGCVVELHGTLHGGWSKKVDRIIDSVQRDVFYGGKVRSWMNGHTQVFLPGADEDVFFVFTHILQHFFKGGIGLRQICDWSRLLWTFRGKLDSGLLEKRLRSAGLMSEWKAFAAMAVEWLGTPVDAIPLYSEASCWKSKAKRIVDLVMDTGNFGHNRDESYKQNVFFTKRLVISFGRRFKDAARQFRIFPLDTMKVWCWVMKTGTKVAVRGK